MNNIIKDNWNIIEEKVIKPMYEDGSFPLTVADEITKALQKQIPKKPEYDCHKHLYICPHCGEYIVTYNQEFPYDMKCGGRLEW